MQSVQGVFPSFFIKLIPYSLTVSVVYVLFSLKKYCMFVILGSKRLDLLSICFFICDVTLSIFISKWGTVWGNDNQEKGTK